MAALDQGMVSKIINATAPVGAAGIPGTWTALSASAMKVRLASAASSASAAGTEITGSGYTAGGQALSTQSTASSAGSTVTLPATSVLSWTNASGGNWSIVSFDVTDNAGVRTWFGNFNGQPVVIANGNTFQIAVNGITLALT
jgi:hypothetical protein